MSKKNQQVKGNLIGIDATALGICLALTAVVYSTGIHPQFARQVEADNARQKLTQLENEATALVNQLTGIKRELSRVEQELAASPLRLQPASAVNQRIAELAKLAEESGLKINQVQPSQGKPGTHYNTVPIRLTGAGRFTEVVGFLNRMHGKFKDVGVAAWSIQGDPAKPDDNAEFSFELSWFTAPSAEEKSK